ncbi:MAG: preprotein translocase subunit YajC [Phototrophicaceae bacterium]
MAEILAVAVIMILGMGGYWAFFLFPRQRDFAMRQNMVRALAEGDEVITAGGIIGKVLKIEGDKGLATVEIADGLEVRVIVASILEQYNPEELAKNAQMGQQAEIE